MFLKHAAAAPIQHILKTFQKKTAEHIQSLTAF